MRLPRQRAAYTTGGEKGGEHPLTFYQYLATIKDEASPAGDPARDALGDDTFPKEADTRGQIRDHLFSCRACSGAYDALDSAWRRYRSALRRKYRFT